MNAHPTMQRAGAALLFCLSFPPLLSACGNGEAPPAGGTRTLIVSDRGGAVRVYEIDPAAASARLVGSPRADDPSYEDAMPARLADGRVILVSNRGGRNALYIVNGDTSTAAPFTPGDLAAGDLAEDSDPAPFGGDGVVFARAEPAPATDAAPDDAAAPAGPAARRRDLYTVRLDGRKLTRLTRHAADDGAPCATPDGRAIIFMSDRSGAFRLYRLDPLAADPEATVAALLPEAGADDASLVGGAGTDNGVQDRDPACLPDGSIVFSRALPAGPAQIYLLDPSAAGAAPETGTGPGVRLITDPLILPHGAGEPVAHGDGLLLTAGPAPLPKGAAAGPRHGVYVISKGGYNLTRITRERAGYNDQARRLRPAR